MLWARADLKTRVAFCLFGIFFCGCVTCRILLPQPGTESVPPALEEQSPNTGLPRKSPNLVSQTLNSNTRQSVPCAQLYLTLCDPTDCSPARLFCPWDFPGKNNRVDCHFLLQGIFSTQGLNLGLKPGSPASLALAGGFFTTEPPGKLVCCCCCC